MLSSVDVARDIAQQLEPAVSAAAKKGAESGGGGKRGRGGGGTIGASISWLVVAYSDLFASSSPKEWRCANEVLLCAAHWVAGGSAMHPVDVFEGVCIRSPDLYCDHLAPARSAGGVTSSDAKNQHR